MGRPALQEPVRWWAAGKTNETTRDILQATLLGGIAQRDGRKHFDGTGVVPGELPPSAAVWHWRIFAVAEKLKRPSMRAAAFC